MKGVSVSKTQRTSKTVACYTVYKKLLICLYTHLKSELFLTLSQAFFNLLNRVELATVLNENSLPKVDV